MSGVIPPQRPCHLSDTARLVCVTVLLCLFTHVTHADYQQDLTTLTQTPHRLAGTPEGRRAGDYLLQRLEGIGVDAVLPLEFPLWQTKVEQCEMSVEGGATIELQPCRPNLIVPPSTGPAGVTGRYLYVGRGALEAYGSRDPAGAIVGLDYDCFDQWELAFALGAKAVVFLGGDNATPSDPKHQPLPANFLRFYAPDAAELKADLPTVTIRSRVTWELTTGRNLIGIIRGTDPGFDAHREADEAVVLAAFYDTFGAVPTRTPGARAAANVAGVLEAAERLVAQRHRRHTVILLLDNRARGHQGAREFYAALYPGGSAKPSGVGSDRDTHRAQLREHLEEAATIDRQLALLHDYGMRFPAEHPEAEAGFAASQLVTAVQDAADWAQADLSKAASILRLQTQPLELELEELGGAVPDELDGIAQTTLGDDDELQSGADRLRRRELVERVTPARAEIRRLAEARAAWDDIRRALHERTLPILIAAVDRVIESGAAGVYDDEELTVAEAERIREQLATLLTNVTARLESRRAELALLQRIDLQRQALREVLTGDPPLEGDAAATEPWWLAVHLTFDLGDASEVWGPVAGDWEPISYPMRPAKREADSPGYYNRLLGVIRGAAETFGPIAGVDDRLLRDPNLGFSFAPGLFTHGGTIAGAYGIYNLACMTGYDGRWRDGHPSDTVANLDADRLRSQAAEATKLTAAMLDVPDLGVTRSFQAVASNTPVVWNRGKPTGSRAALSVTGGLSENRPASGAVVATFPGPATGALNTFTNLRDLTRMADFSPLALEPVDQLGRFRLTSLRSDTADQLTILAATFDARGRVVAISNQKTLGQRLTQAIRVDLIGSTGYAFASITPFDTKPELLDVLKAGSDTAFRDNRSLIGQVGWSGFFYLSDNEVRDTIKVFQPRGLAVLGRFTDDESAGTGVPVTRFDLPPWLTDESATDLHALNEQRLSRLRARGVTSSDLERFHARSGRLLEAAGGIGDRVSGIGDVGDGYAATPAAAAPAAASDLPDTTSQMPDSALADREGLLQRAAAFSRVVYPQVRSAMDDLVYAIVLLLLLAIPFAFAMERLAVGATTIYGRIAGFFVAFFITFFLLYFMHPGFAIASTPIIIFLAFAIILLSSMVIWIVVRKFDTELKHIQGQSGGAHELEVSRAGTLLAAVGMGMSTMRRRPTRTILTAVTVVMLTFTILCFASFSREIGIRRVPLGPVAAEMPNGILVRNIDYSAIPRGQLPLLQGLDGVSNGGSLSPQFWLVQTKVGRGDYTIARPDDGRSMTLSAVMGVSNEEVDRWPELAAALRIVPSQPASSPTLGTNNVFLPPIVREVLNLQPGDEVLLYGKRVTFAGTLDSPKMQQLRHLDGQAVTPVDFQDAAAQQAEGSGGGQAEDDASLLSEDVQKDFVHLSADQIAVVSNDLARRLGGELHLVTVYPEPGADASELGDLLATVSGRPIWVAGPTGVERRILTLLTSLAGGWQLGVPLLLGGLIIFGTLLGSIQDREKEIYTFSALGLAPTHVGVLFFAEAAVYAVVGGMGGQLLAQAVALIAGELANAGYLQPASINYSSTNSLFAIGVVMLTVLVSAIYPAMRASKSANPGLARAWRLPPAEGDELKLTFPFTVSAYDITGVVSYLAEHFRRHDDAGLGNFAASNVAISRDVNGNLVLESDLALAPFDLGVTQHMKLTAVPSDIPGVDEVAIHSHRLSGATGDWYRANKVFMRDLRRQFLVWRTLAADVIEDYRHETLEALGEDVTHAKTQSRKEEHEVASPWPDATPG